MKQKILELRPVKEGGIEFQRLEKRIKDIFKELIYKPLLQEFGISKIQNSKDDLYDALKSGKITYTGKAFVGHFDSETSRQLRLLGATWKNGGYEIAIQDLPMEVRAGISTGNQRYIERIDKIDKRLAKVDPAKIAESVKSADLFEKTLIKTDKAIGKSLKNITVFPELTAKERKDIADEWQNNMDLWISNFTELEIVRLRKDIAKSVSASNRRQSLEKAIRRSYGVTANKARFLARQETSLLMAKMKKARYAKAGVNEYKWKCVAGSAAHPVRPMHKILNDLSDKGKIFKFNDPPIDDPNGGRHNPGENYNCRCTAIPVVRF